MLLLFRQVNMPNKGIKKKMIGIVGRMHELNRPDFFHFYQNSAVVVFLRDYSVDSKKIEAKPVSPRYASPSFYEILQAIPTGIKKITNEIRAYNNIEDASRTRQNAWTVKSQLSKAEHPATTIESSSASMDNEISFPHNTNRLGRIPRRQQEQQRRLLRELKIALPVTLAAMLPVIGNVFILAIAISPRYFLSYHFLKEEYIRSFAAQGYGQRLAHYSQCADNFCHLIEITPIEEALNLLKMDVLCHDAAGPIFGDVMPLYNFFSQRNTKSDKLKVTTKIPDIAFMTREHIITLAHSSGLSSPILWLLPRFWISYRLKEIVNDISMDDLLLIEERHHEERCILLTKEEVREACVIRGLPTKIDTSLEEMRNCLTNHLYMMEQIIVSVGKRALKESVASLFILYLPVLRQKLRSITK